MWVTHIYGCVAGSTYSTDSKACWRLVFVCVSRRQNEKKISTYSKRKKKLSMHLFNFFQFFIISHSIRSETFRSIDSPTSKFDNFKHFNCIPFEAGIENQFEIAKRAWIRTHTHTHRGAKEKTTPMTMTTEKRLVESEKKERKKNNIMCWIGETFSHCICKHYGFCLLLRVKLESNERGSHICNDCLSICSCFFFLFYSVLRDM